ncbi:MAG: GEVED domain-containing protein [Bacteroidota bacterium]
MKQKYNLPINLHGKTNACDSSFTKSKISLVFALLFTFFGLSDAFGAVGVTPANGTANSCKLPTDYVTLGNIVINEGADGDFSMPGSGTNYTLILNAPLNFEFNAGVGSVTANGADIDNISMVVTTTTITITYNSSQGNRSNGDDIVTISGIQFRGITIASSGNITRPAVGGGTGAIAGITAAVTNFGTLTSTNTPPTAIGGGAANVCTGANTPAFTNAVSGGTWSIIAGTGTASVSVGGVVTGLTAGTVTVRYTIGTCAPANIALTVSQTPGAIGGGAAIVCMGTPSAAFTNPNAGGTWSIINGTGSASITAGGVVSGITTGTATVVYMIGSCTATTPITIVATPSITTNPINFSTNTGGNASFTVAASNTPTSYTWQVSTDGGGTWTTIANGGVYSTATTATLNITGVTLAMNNYQYHALATNACGASAYSTAATLTVSNIVLVSGLGVNNVMCGENTILRDHNNLANYANSRDDWSALNVTSTAVVNINGTYDTESGSDGIILYDGVGIAGTQLAVYTGAGTINYTGTAGQTITVRFISNFNIIAPGFNLNVTYTGNCNVPCVAPTTQPTALSLSPSATVISGSFTHASPLPDNYLVVISTSAVAPTPVNGVTYTIGGTVGAGYTVVDTDTNNSFSASGLTPSTVYYFYIFSFNKLCIGGPTYRTVTPLIGNTTTLATDPYCFPTYGATTTRYIDNVFTVGAITNLNNMGSGRSGSGYGDFTASTPVTQIPGGGVAIDYLLKVSRQFVEIWVDWDKNGVFADAAPELVYNSGATQTIEGTGGFVVPGGTAPGTYRIRIRTREDAATIAPCAGAYAAGETEDYRLVVVADCAAKPTFVHDGDRCDDGVVALGVEGAVGVTQFRFYSSLYGGTLIGTQAAVPGITYWNTPFLTATTKYYVTAWNGTCESWYRTEVVATINPTTNINVTPSIPEVCGENNVVTITAGGDEIIDYLVNENFEGGLGTMVRFNVGGQADANTQWTARTSPYVPTGTVWKPAITSSAIGNGFVLANSDFAAPNPKDTQLRTTVLNATAYSDLYLDFRHHFSYYPGEPAQFGYVDISTNGGGAWTTLQTYTSNQGYAGEFTSATINLSAYAGMNNLMVRFRFYLAGGSAWANGWAIDDVKVYGNRPLNTTFTWTGGTVNAYIDAACTIPYAAQNVVTVYVQPTAAQLASTSWSFTANATLGNGCPVSEFITITNKTKLWKGTVNSDWNQANNWSPAGVPDANTCVIIYDGPNDSRIIGSFYNAFAKYVIVRSNGDLLVNTNNTLTITDNLNVEAGGIATFDNGSSLLQVNNTANIGNITYRRTANIRRQDYVYWSSPIASFANSAVSPGTNLGYQYKWLPTTGGTNNFGNWTLANETMVLGKGYCLRGPDTYSLSALTNYTASFIGVPNNGIITIPISRGTWNGGTYSTGVSTTLGTNEDDNWNLVGNPYPSAINAINFLTLNTNIAGFVNIWTHGTLPSNAIVDPFYNDYAYNYTPSDYITYNSVGASSGPGVFNGQINAGQGFFVSMLHTSAATTENLTFNNTLRSNTYNNNAFYKTTTNNKNPEEFEKHRIWFDLVGPSGNSTRSLLGYVENATNENDRLFDAFSNQKLSFNIFSLIEDEQMLIQGRALPFNKAEKVNIGVSIPQDGLYKIALSTVDGLFSDEKQNIYLEDKLLKITYDLKDAPYSFIANKGTIKDRFVLKFEKETNSNSVEELTNQLNVYDNNVLTVESRKLKIKNIQIFDILGKQLLTKNNVNNTTYQANGLTRTNSLMIVKVTLEDNSEEVRKVIY